MSDILDLDVFVPEERELKLGGKTLDLTSIPFDLTLRFYDLIPIFGEIEKNKTIAQADVQTILNLIVDVFKMSDNTIDYEWVRKHVTLRRFNQIVLFIFKSMFGDDVKKNIEQEVK